jgi:hypothetical protein
MFALKGQKLLAQGSALGMVISDNVRPEGAKALIFCAILLVLLPLQGERNTLNVNPRRCLGLGAFALSGRASPKDVRTSLQSCPNVFAFATARLCRRDLTSLPLRLDVFSKASGSYRQKSALLLPEERAPIARRARSYRRKSALLLAKHPALLRRAFPSGRHSDLYRGERARVAGRQNTYK